MRSATVFFALAAAFASAADDKKSPLEEFNIVAGNVELRERGKLPLLLLIFFSRCVPVFRGLVL